MDFSRKYLAGIRLILGTMLIVALTSTFLMERMSTAIKLILNENVYSVEAAEDMIINLALYNISPMDLHQEQFMEALTRAKNNITLKGEKTLIHRIEQLVPAAFEGQQRGRRQLIEELENLAVLNREAMLRADEDARFLAIAGGWAIVGLAVVGLLISSRVLTQVQRHAIDPMVEICRGVTDWEQGNRLRRFQVSQSSKDLRRTQETLNHILDRLS